MGVKVRQFLSLFFVLIITVCFHDRMILFNVLYNLYRCNPDIPLLLKRSTFCSSNVLARNFIYYTSWSMTFMLRQASKQVHTFPDVMFSLNEWSDYGLSCLPDRLPALRVTSEIAANLRSDPQHTLFNQLSQECVLLSYCLSHMPIT